MRVRVSYVVDADDDFRMAIRHQWGQCGTLATRDEIQTYMERVGRSNDDDLMQEWRDCEDGCQADPPPMTPEELAAIRERDAAALTGEEFTPEYGQAVADRRALLAHIDAITEAVEGLEPRPFVGLAPSGWFFDGFDEAKDNILALLRGTPQR